MDKYTERKIEVTDDDFDLYDNENTRMQVDPTKRKIINQYLERKYFLEEFVEAMIVVDPLDRIDPKQYPGMDDPAVRSVEQLKQQILNETKFFQGVDTLQVNLLKDNSFYRWVDDELRNLKEIAL